MKALAKILALAIPLFHFVEPVYSQQRYFDYSGDDGCSPANIGHRLGGDLDNFEDNTIEGMRAITSKQSSTCFKNWEFDLSEWKGALFLSHDPIVSDNQISSLVSLTEFESAFKSVEVSKPIVIDLKYISTQVALEKIVPFVRNIRATQKQEVWFLVHPENVPALSEICPMISGEFDVMLYRRGGEYCGQL